MKTGAYWFSFLTEKEQEEFKVNCDEFNGIDMALDVESFEDFIHDYFIWKSTPQGYKYWHEISQRKTD